MRDFSDLPTRSIYVYARKEYPYSVDDCEIMDAAESMLSIVNGLRKKEHYVKQLLGKTSLTVEQKLTYIAAVIALECDDSPLFGEHDYSEDTAFNAICMQQVEVIDTLA